MKGVGIGDLVMLQWPGCWLVGEVVELYTCKSEVELFKLFFWKDLIPDAASEAAAREEYRIYVPSGIYAVWKLRVLQHNMLGEVLSTITTSGLMHARFDLEHAIACNQIK